MFVYLQTDCRGTVARINFYGVERCLFHRSQTRVGLMPRISDLTADLLIALSKFMVDAQRGILIHLGVCVFEAGWINANLSRQFTLGRCRPEEHTSVLQLIIRISSDVLRLRKYTIKPHN